MRNILRKARRKLVVAAVGIGSVFSAGCDIEDVLYAMNSMGEGDKSALVSKLSNRDYNANGTISGFNPRNIRIPITRGGQGIQIRPYDVPHRGVPDYHANIDPLPPSSKLPPGIPHVIPYRIPSVIGRVPYLIMPIPNALVYPFLLPQEQINGHF